MDATWLGLEKKTVIVTGGASGIGYAIAQELLADGANVVVCDINEEAPVFNGVQGRELYVVTDVTDKNSVERMVAKAKTHFDTIDVLINNAGINIPCLLVDMQGQYELGEVVWDKVMDVNVKGVMLCTQAVAREMMTQGHGIILNMSSECGLEGSEGQSVYAASKSAVNALTRSWAKELGKKGVRVVGVAPGIMEATGLRTLAYENALAYTRGVTVETLRASYANVGSIPLGRSGKLCEVANVVAYLISERASYLHGVTIPVTGGKSRG